MARIRAIVGALWTATRRNRSSLLSFSGNNMFYLAVTLLAMTDREGFAFFLVLISIILFFPMSSDPLRAVPRDRFELWPLQQRERRILRMLTVWLNPLPWALAGLLLWRRVTLGLWAAIAGLFTAGFISPVGTRVTWSRWIPRFPGPLNQLIRKNTRQLLSTLDVYVAMMLAVPAFALRVRSGLPDDSRLPLTIMIVLTMSTCGQTLFGLDGDSGITRYQLLPIRGWQILIAKDLPFLIASFLFTLALAPVPGVASGLAALAVGHSASVDARRAQRRWRFQSAASFGMSIGQIVALIAAAGTTNSLGWWVLVVCIIPYAASVWWFGRRLEEISYLGPR